MQTIRDNLATIVAGLVLAAVLATLWAFLGPWQRAGGTLRALVHDGDGGVTTLALDKDAELVVATELGSNTVVVSDGAVRISEADCPQGRCLHQRPISAPGEQLVCLPHHLWVEIVADDGTSASMDVDAVTWEEAADVDLVSQ